MGDSLETVIDETFGKRFMKEYKGDSIVLWAKEDVIENGVVQKDKIKVVMIGMEEISLSQIKRIMVGIPIESYHLAPMTHEKKDMFSLTMIVCKTPPPPPVVTPIPILSTDLCENIKMRSVDRGSIKKIPDEVRNQMLTVASLLSPMEYKDVVVGASYIAYKGISDFKWCMQVPKDCDVLFSMSDLSLEDADPDTGKTSIRVEKVFSAKVTFPMPTNKKRSFFSYLTGK